MKKYLLNSTSPWSRVGWVLIFIFTLLGCSRGSEEGKILYGKELATWSRSIFFRGYAPTSGEALTEENLAEFAATLKNNKVRYAYIFSGPFALNGSLPEWSVSPRAIESIKRIKEVYPSLKILPWIGGIEGRTIRVVDSVWREGALNATRQLVTQLPVDGVHVDFEKIDLAQGRESSAPAEKDAADGAKYAAGVIEFHRQLREQLPDLFVSSVVVSTAPGTVPWKRKHTLAELQQLFPLVDQISFLMYDTSIRDELVFEENVKFQLEQIRELKQRASERAPQVLFAIGSFINEPELRHYRNMEIENIPNTLQVLKRELARVKSPVLLIDGLALYCEWQTGPEEWRQIQENWP